MSLDILSNLKVGFAFTGSFCTIETCVNEIQNLVNSGADVFPIVSNNVKTIDTRFGKAEDLMKKLSEITGKQPMETIVEVEQIGPNGIIDILVVAPCTGNTLAKIANAITDTSVTMAVKAHLRNQKPLVISVSTNDALGANAVNIGKLLNAKNTYFVPFYQDNPQGKSNSLIADTKLIISTIKEAMNGKQIQPIILK